MAFMGEARNCDSSGGNRPESCRVVHVCKAMAIILLSVKGVESIGSQLVVTWQ